MRVLFIITATRVEITGSAGVSLKSAWSEKGNPGACSGLECQQMRTGGRRIAGMQK